MNEVALIACAADSRVLEINLQTGEPIKQYSERHFQLGKRGGAGYDHAGNIVYAKSFSVDTFHSTNTTTRIPSSPPHSQAESLKYLRPSLTRGNSTESLNGHRGTVMWHRDSNGLQSIRHDSNESVTLCLWHNHYLTTCLADGSIQLFSTLHQ